MRTTQEIEAITDSVSNYDTERMAERFISTSSEGAFSSDWYSASVCDMKKVDFLFDVLVSF